MLNLKMQGIGTQVHYMPIPMHPTYVKAGHTMSKLPVAAAYYEQALSIPLFYALTDHQQSFVASAIIETLRKSKEPK